MLRERKINNPKYDAAWYRPVAYYGIWDDATMADQKSFDDFVRELETNFTAKEFRNDPFYYVTVYKMPDGTCYELHIEADYMVAEYLYKVKAEE